MRFVEELKGNIVDRPFIDAREAVGPGAKSLFLGMINETVGGGGRLGVLLSQYYRHPSMMVSSASATFDHHRRTNTRVILAPKVPTLARTRLRRTGLPEVACARRVNNATATAHNFTPVSARLAADETIRRRGSERGTRTLERGDITMATAAESPVPSESTEIRCQEKSKGGLCYEVILAEPTVPKRAPSPPQQQSPTQQIAIEDKLKAAEERRLSIEAHKLAALAAKLSKIEEAARKKDELSAAFIAATRESLDAKMNNTEEKREAHIAELKNKLKEHLESVEKTRLSLEQQTEEVRCAVEEKLKTAAAQRDENIKRMLDRLKEHEEQVARVRQGMSERVQQLESQIQGKLEQARERRETIEREQKEKLRNHERRAKMVRQNKKERQDVNPVDASQPILPVENETASSG
ncbi:calponin homology domain-containing protein DDB_G0272472 isoform X2 [Pogonomyrmex barbatus]|uniref:Calponin homology domain-containing protein DDB_G0272472 isoform X2 n=1 Tax=Pogonomyrmex barbatus TaxID=144034 RepID=A0A6I9WML2_9HYME|nr:calponin homology domain-containing protein DDB_G0272472 isoform X2 [Pogonomyrmex barbatus]